MADRGWFEQARNLVFQPARVSAFSERSSFLRPHELEPGTFDDLRQEARRQLRRFDASGLARVEESEVPNGFPSRRSSVCGALARDSVVVGADGHLFRCGLQVSEPARAVGTLQGAATQEPRAKRALPVLRDHDQQHAQQKRWWDNFDPTRLASLSKHRYRRFTAEEKIVILNEAEQPGVSAAEVCRKHCIAPSPLYNWRGGAGRADPRGQARPDTEVARMQAELDRMLAVVAEITAENLELKKLRLGELSRVPTATKVEVLQVVELT